MDKHIAGPWFPVWHSPGLDFTETIFRNLKQQPWFNGLGVIVLPYPRQFQFIYFILCHLEFSLPILLRTMQISDMPLPLLSPSGLLTDYPPMLQASGHLPDALQRIRLSFPGKAIATPQADVHNM